MKTSLTALATLFLALSLAPKARAETGSGAVATCKVTVQYQGTFIDPVSAFTPGMGTRSLLLGITKFFNTQKNKQVNGNGPVTQVYSLYLVRMFKGKQQVQLYGNVRANALSRNMEDEQRLGKQFALKNGCAAENTQVEEGEFA